VDVKQIRYFIKIVEVGSFTKAAELLGIAQPSLGFQIRKLEQELRVQLLLRNSRGVELTPPGRALFELGQKILADMQSLGQRVSDMADTPHGQVALGITPTLAGRLLVPLFKWTRERLPAVSLEVTEELSSTLVDLLNVGRLDLVLAYDVIPARGLHIERMAREQIWFVYGRDGRDSKPSAISFRELAVHDLILPGRPHRLRQLAENASRQSGIPLHVVSEMQSMPTILRLVEGGLGCTLKAGGLDAGMDSSRLAARPVVEPALHLDIVLVHADMRPLSRAGDAMAALIRELMSSVYPPGYIAPR
jgi:LysR family transcriptional regulator, nitrogen assimilation regulatory protein